MKKLLSLLLLLPLASQAQQVPVVLKYNLGRLVNLQLGVAAEFFLSPNVSLQPQLFYSSNTYQTQLLIQPDNVPINSGYYYGGAELSGPGGALEIRKYGSSSADSRPKGPYIAFSTAFSSLRPVANRNYYYYTDPQGNRIDEPTFSGTVTQLDVATRIGFQFVFLKDAVVDLGLGPQLRMEDYKDQHISRLMPSGNLMVGLMLRPAAPK